MSKAARKRTSTIQSLVGEHTKQILLSDRTTLADRVKTRKRGRGLTLTDGGELVLSQCQEASFGRGDRLKGRKNIVIGASSAREDNSYIVNEVLKRRAYVFRARLKETQTQVDTYKNLQQNSQRIFKKIEDMLIRAQMAEKVVEAHPRSIIKHVLRDNNTAATTQEGDSNHDHVVKGRLANDVTRTGPGQKENMRRATSLSVSTRGRKRAEKKDSCCNGCSSSPAAPLRRCFSETESSNSSSSNPSDETSESTSNSSAWRSDNGSPSLELQETMEHPPSPTANLKMLISAVSPEIRKMQRQQELQLESEAAGLGDPLGGGESDVMSSQESDPGKTLLHGSRKEKSLGLLCEKFLQQYPENPRGMEQIEICLDEVAKTLNVERRRIYDIVNVLESVEVVSRMAKNKYVWHGKTNLNTTLTRLKMLAIQEGFAEQIKRLKERELAKELNPDACPATPEREEEVVTPGGPDEDPLSDIKHKGEMRKDKSLGIMSQKFLMLFLVSKPQTVNLDMSAKILIGDQQLERLETSKFKTKIRRLYDIANILTSLKLIKKVAVTEFRGRKPAFRYIGPDIDSLDASHAQLCYTDGWHRPSTRHSMLDCIRNDSASFLANNTFRPIRPALPTEGSRAGPVKRELSDSSTSSAPAMSRHSSFEQFFAVVESELSRLHSCSSQPCSPIKKLNFDVEETPTELKRCNTDPQVDNSSVQQPPPPTSVAAVTVPSQSVPVTATTGRINQKSNNTVRVFPHSDTVIIKAKSFSGTGMGKAPTVLPLTPVQIKGILQSFKHPVKTKQDASTQSSMDKVSAAAGKSATELLSPPGLNMASMNELTPVSSTTSGGSLPALIGISRKRGYIDVAMPGGDKRVKVDVTTPPSPCSVPGREKDSVETQVKPKSSSTRALTFMSDPQCLEPPGSITVCPAKPVATRPQSIQRITVQVAGGAAPPNRDGNSVFHLPVVNVGQSEPNGKIVLTGLPASGSQLSHQMVQAMPVTCYVTPSSKQMLGDTPPSSSGKPTVVATSSSASHPSVHIIHSAPVSTSTSHLMVPMTFSPPLTPSDDQPAMFTFAGMAGSPSSQTQSVSAFHVVQQVPPPQSSLKVITPASPMVSPTHVQVFNVVASPNSANTSTVLKAETNSL